MKGVIEADERLVRTVYSCLLCRLDEENCGARIPCAEIYENMRAHLVEKGVGPLPEHEALTASLRNYGNPWMQPKTAREKWIKRSKLPLKEEGEGAKSLYYSGCTFPLDPSIQSVPLAVAKLFRLAGEKFALLGKDEVCCGSTSLRIGERKLFEELRQKNMEKLKQYERVITSCAGCYKTMSQDYPDSDGKPEILHSLQVLRDLLKGGKLKPSETKVRVTYHDPCHLGRHSGMYDIPREIINSIPGVELVEMRNSRELARCCGSGAGVKAANPEVSLEIAKRRVEEACETGAEILLSACPFCEQGLIDATKAMKKKIKVMDIAELLLEACD